MLQYHFTVDCHRLSPLGFEPVFDGGLSLRALSVLGVPWAHIVAQGVLCSVMQPDQNDPRS